MSEQDRIPSEQELWDLLTDPIEVAAKPEPKAPRPKSGPRFAKEAPVKDGFEDMGKRLSQVSEFILISKATFGSYSSAVKNVLDRSISYVLPFFEIRNGEMHHGERYHNDLTVSALFYGHMTENEKRTAKNLVQANAVNLNAALGKVHFVEDMDDIREVLV